MATLSLTTHFDMLAAAANATEFSDGGGATQVWVDIFASAFQGLATLPIALVIVWLLSKTGLARWTLLRALVASVFSILIAVLFEILGLSFWAAVSRGLSAIGLQQFVYELWPAIGVIFFGSLLFSYWLRRRHNSENDLWPDVFE